MHTIIRENIQGCQPHKFAPATMLVLLNKIRVKNLNVQKIKKQFQNFFLINGNKYCKAMIRRNPKTGSGSLLFPICFWKHKVLVETFLEISKIETNLEFFFLRNGNEYGKATIRRKPETIENFLETKNFHIQLMDFSLLYSRYSDFY